MRAWPSSTCALTPSSPSSMAPCASTTGTWRMSFSRMMSHASPVLALRSTVTGFGSARALAATAIICPGPTRTDSPRRPARDSRTVPSRQMSLTVPGLPGLYSIMMVVPVMAAVTGALLMVAPPAPLGTCRRMDPFSKSRLRVPRSKLKSVLAPRRARVWSAKVSWARELPPVRTPARPLTTSPRSAGCGAPPSGMISTLLTTRVTVASLSGAA